MSSDNKYDFVYPLMHRKNKYASPYDVSVYIDDELVIKDDNMYLPVGTKLYHGSLDDELENKIFNHSIRHKYTFFGIDVIISLWYIAEMNTKGINEKDIGYLYEFELTSQLPIKEIIFEGDKISDCIPGSKWCDELPYIHPQYANESETKEVCIELTLPVIKYKNHLKFNKKYLVDAKKLTFEYHEGNIDIFDPTTTIIV
jgi:hypothetical protein